MKRQPLININKMLSRFMIDQISALHYYIHYRAHKQSLIPFSHRKIRQKYTEEVSERKTELNFNSHNGNNLQDKE